MPIAHLPNGSRLHYERQGTGPAVLALAPGGLRSRAALWRQTHDGRARPWPDPVALLAPYFDVIAIDQRNAGQSWAPLRASDGWDAYADDHIQLLDALGIERFHILGACIGPSFALKLIERQPQRVRSAVLQQPIGYTDDNAALRHASFQEWAEGLAALGHQADPAVLAAIERNLFGSADFVFSVSRDSVRRSTTPLLILPGDDARHPAKTADELRALRPDAQWLSPWQGVDHAQAYAQTVLGFLQAHNAP